MTDVAEQGVDGGGGAPVGGVAIRMKSLGSETDCLVAALAPRQGPVRR